MEKGRTVTNIPGAIRTVDCGNGIYELVKEPDVLTIIPHKKKRNTTGIILAFVALALTIGAVATIIYLAPPIGTLMFAVIAWCGIAAATTKE